MRISTFLCLGLALGLLGTTSCASNRTTVDAPATADIDALNAGIHEVAHRTLAGTSSDYVIDPPDVIGIHVRDNEDLSQESLTVGPDGKVSMKWIGTVTVAGRTVEEISQELSNRYSKYIRDAVVTVVVEQYQSKFIYVQGEVKVEGRFPWTGHDTVVNALSQAGFLTRRASPNGIHVARGNPNDPEIYPVRLKDIILEDDSRTNWYLQPEDIVHVPPTFLSKVGYAFEEILFPFQPLYAPASAANQYQDYRDR